MKKNSVEIGELESKKIAAELKRKLKRYSFSLAKEPIGEVIEIGDGVARATGLSQAGYQELVKFESGVYGVILSLDREEVGIVVLGDYEKINEGEKVTATGRLLSVPVSEELIGRVVNPLGEPLDNKGAIRVESHYPLEKIAPGVTVRQPVDTPVQTGIMAIDSMIPIGRGQRELIIGDRATGKTAITLDTIINQKGKNLICIYVAIGQRAAKVAQVIEQFRKYDALGHTIVVAANASDAASLQYLAPYAGCAIGEYFMDKGKDALVVYDDLTKHAWAYRQISLILRRPTGREAYPGDIFYLHSRLLERACKLDKKHGGGSLTALPIIETQQGDLSAYIPTNVISITDGQIYLESDLFYAGLRPAINVGLSVSRVGGAAQIPAMKKVAGKLRLELAQYRELSAFVQFAQELDEATRKRIARGARLTELLKQPQFQPLPVAEQVVSIWAVTHGYADDFPVEEISRFKEELIAFIKASNPELLSKIDKEKDLTDKLISKLEKAMKQFVKQFSREHIHHSES